MVTLLHKPFFSKMSNKGEGGVKNLKKWVTLFMDGPLSIFFLHFSKQVLVLISGLKIFYYITIISEIRHLLQYLIKSAKKKIVLAGPAT